MKQTRPLSGFSCLSEYTRLHSITQTSVIFYISDQVCRRLNSLLGSLAFNVDVAFNLTSRYFFVSFPLIECKMTTLKKK